MKYERGQSLSSPSPAPSPSPARDFAGKLKLKYAVHKVLPNMQLF